MIKIVDAPGAQESTPVALNTKISDVSGLSILTKRAIVNNLKDDVYKGDKRVETFDDLRKVKARLDKDGKVTARTLEEIKDFIDKNFPDVKFPPLDKELPFIEKYSLDAEVQEVHELSNLARRGLLSLGAKSLKDLLTIEKKLSSVPKIGPETTEEVRRFLKRNFPEQIFGFID